MGIQPIIGCEFDIALPFSKHYPSTTPTDTLVFLVQNAQGYTNLIQLMNHFYLRSDIENTEKPLLSLDWLKHHSQGLFLLLGSSLKAHLLKHPPEAFTQWLLSLRTLFGDRLYIELVRYPDAFSPEAQQKCAGLIELAYSYDLSLLATNNCYYLQQEDYEAHDVLLCIAYNQVTSSQSRPRALRDQWLKPTSEMCRLFADIPEAIENTLILAQRCSFLLATEVQPVLPTFPVTSGTDENQELYRKASTSLKQRLQHGLGPFGQGSEEEQRQREHVYWRRFQHEYDIITQMGYAGYFLIVSDFMQWARHKHIAIAIQRFRGYFTDCMVFRYYKCPTRSGDFWSGF